MTNLKLLDVLLDNRTHGFKTVTLVTNSGNVILPFKVGDDVEVIGQILRGGEFVSILLDGKLILGEFN